MKLSKAFTEYVVQICYSGGKVSDRRKKRLIAGSFVFAFSASHAASAVALAAASMATPPSLDPQNSDEPVQVRLHSGGTLDSPMNFIDGMKMNAGAKSDAETVFGDHDVRHAAQKQTAATSVVAGVFLADHETKLLQGNLDNSELDAVTLESAVLGLRNLIITYEAESPVWLDGSTLVASLPVEDATDILSRDVSESLRVAFGGATGSSEDSEALQFAGLEKLNIGGASAAAVDTALAMIESDDAPVVTTDLADAATQQDGIVIEPAAASLLGDLGNFAMPPAQTINGRVSIHQAVSIALATNPEINEASANREGIEFELRQGRGLYLPSIDLEARAGAQVVDRPSTRRNGDDDHVFGPVEGRLTVTQVLFDGFNREAEVERQASRVDDASFRVEERSEAIALNVIRAHLDIHRLKKILRLAEANLAFHRRVLSDISRGSSQGAISDADRQQAEERILAAEAFIIENRERLETARITFYRLVGQFPSRVDFAPSVASKLPRGLDRAIGVARANNSLIKIEDAALSTAYAEVRQARSGYLPTLNLELTGRVGEDLDGVRGRDAEFQALMVMRWNLYNGGIRPAGVQAGIRRVDEQRQRLYLAQRQVEESMRSSWNSWEKQRQRLSERTRQLRTAEELLGSYREQFKIGQRSLLDVLDTQNSKFNTQVAVVTSRHAARFAEYRILASAGVLLDNLRLKGPETAEAYARADADVPEVPSDDVFVRTQPNRQ